MKDINLLFIGRFQPFHLGHLKIIKKYSKKEFFIKIGVGSSEESHKKENPFTFEERKKMIQLALKKEGIKNYSIFALPDFKGADNSWRKNVKKVVGNFNFLITGNVWVRRIFEEGVVGVFSYNENEMRHNGLEGKEIRKDLLRGKRKGIPLEVYRYLVKIKAVERLKNIN